ncbi:LUD domain-containing protein, partial [Streptococcus pneumoniae]|uniref:LUD domain-containing protein n=1 Tax=Streptococcus pneumoniae TaxID=1313 RepID=UPI0013E99272
PAIHRNREEIRDIFLREMPETDESLTSEPADLAEASRRHLREKFLSTKVAISGANFGVAETGTLAVVESEGNGRMCLTLWTGVTEGDGPQEFHLVLLDNGRSAVLSDPKGRSALHCIRCSACMN